jgi:photosystem II stability/assembly factor-like uncharacterized protein
VPVQRFGRVRGGAALGVALAAGLVAPSGAARADGALPASLGVIVPADRPQEIILSTNFGLIETDDGGATWLWTCEQQATNLASRYAMSGPPRDRLFAVSLSSGLALSDDLGCSWTLAGGALATATATDYFVDPNDPDRVLAIALSRPDGSYGPDAVYASSDGGATFAATALLVAPAGMTLTGVEIARSDAQVVTVTGYEGTAASGYHPWLMRSADGGQTWTSTDLQPTLGANLVFILAIDPANADLVYFRVSRAAGDSVGVTRDGGATLAVPLTLPSGALSAFARLASGTVLVGAVAAADGGSAGAGYRSTDGGASFQPWTLSPQPHFMGFAERAGTLYLSGDNRLDGWALATSGDEGATIHPLMSYGAVNGVKPCVAAACAAGCAFEVSARVWSNAVCGGGDGGATPPPAGGSSGCGCGAASYPRGGGSVGLWLVLVAIVLRFGRRAIRASRRSSRSISKPRV